jgi:hypothetical protein
MHLRQIATVMLAIGLLLPVGAAAPVALQSTDASPSNQASAVQQSSASGTAGSAQQGTTSAANVSNYTRLYIEDEYRNLELKPGESDSFTVTVENGEESAVDLSPHVFVPKLGERPVNQEWVTIEPADTTLDAGDEQEFTVSVAVPEDAELAEYRGMIAFTDETVTYPGRPARPVHAISFNLRVFTEPTVHIVEGEHGHAQIQAGESHTHSIVIENTGDAAVPLNPKVSSERRPHPTEDPSLERSWIELDAPSEVQPGDTASVDVTIAPSQDAAVGDYDFELDLGLKDPARDDRSPYWQQVHLGFQVWKQPDAPFTTGFTVTEQTEDVTLTLTTHRRTTTASEPPRFDVSFVSPNGTVVEADRERVTTSGNVDLARQEDTPGDSPYASPGNERAFTYSLDEPGAGEWTARIMPHNAIDFRYELLRNED